MCVAEAERELREGRQRSQGMGEQRAVESVRCKGRGVGCLGGGREPARGGGGVGVGDAIGRGDVYKVQ